MLKILGAWYCDDHIVLRLPDQSLKMFRNLTFKPVDPQALKPYHSADPRNFTPHFGNKTPVSDYILRFYGLEKIT